jgi:hypothetical protein
MLNEEIVRAGYGWADDLSTEYKAFQEAPGGLQGRQRGKTRVMERLEKRMKKTSVNQVVDKAINEIISLAENLESVNVNKLATDLWDLESKAGALRSFILNKVIRTA